MNQNEQLRTVLLQQLESLRAFGVQTVPKGFGNLKALPPAPTEKSPSEASTHAPNRAADPAEKAAVADHAVAEPKTEMAVSGSDMPKERLGEGATLVPPNQRADLLKVIQTEVENCETCEGLCANRNKTVFGVGDPNARLVFVGEGPSADEDRTGEPFAGDAGQLLDKILAACKLSRDQIYILNTVKCRPPGDRNPTETELANCWPYGIRQLEIIQPEFICCLGSVAAKTILKTKLSIGKLRGQFHSFGSSKVLVTYHPAYLLHTPSAKKHTWNDMKMLMSEMGISI